MIILEKQKIDLIKGKNAIYLDGIKEIHLNKVNAGNLIFHELGHAKNYNSKNRLMKTLITIKHPFLSNTIWLAGLGCALLSRPKEEDKDTFWGKTKNFLKDNSVAIGAVGLIANTLEEGLASIRGANIAKKILDPKQVRKINKLNSIGLLTYICSTLGSILTIYATKKITDMNNPITNNN